MSNFLCGQCSKEIIEGPDGRYETECIHHPIEEPKPVEKHQIKNMDSIISALSGGLEIYKNDPTFIPSQLAVIEEGSDRLNDICEGLEKELHDLREFVRNLNSIAFEEWHGRYEGSELFIEPTRFVIFDGEDNEIASGKDCLEAISRFTEEENGK